MTLREKCRRAEMVLGIDADVIMRSVLSLRMEKERPSGINYEEKCWFSIPDGHLICLQKERV